MSSCLQQIPVHTAPPYQVTVGPGLLRTCGPRLQEVLSPCRIAVITDSHVAPLYLERVCESLQSAASPWSAGWSPPESSTKPWPRWPSCWNFWRRST